MDSDRKAEITTVVIDGVAQQQQQRRKMLVALALLLFALIGVLVKDWDFWFPPAPVAEMEPSHPVSAQSTVPDLQPPPSAKPSRNSRLRKKAHALTPLPSAQAAVEAPVVTTSRAVLPPLEVEVVAGDRHRAIHPGDTSVEVEMQPLSGERSAQNDGAGAADGDGLTTTAAERVRLSPDTADVVSHPVEPSYPMLAKQMKVQGAVVLQALIAKSGNIQDLQVISGPVILSEAARQAVRQWRFKPYYQAGQPVETAARITVNFTISTY